MRLNSLHVLDELDLLYDEARLEKDKRRGLNWILGGNMCGNLFGIICGGGTAALVGLAACFGATDLQYGLLVAIPQIAAILQIPFSALVNKTHQHKRYLLTWGLFSRILWLVFGFLTLLQPSLGDAAVMRILMLILTVSSLCSAMINVSWFPWFSELAPLDIRGRWLSLRDAIIAIVTLLFGLLVAWLLDVIPGNAKYISIFLLGGVLGMMDMLCFAFVPETTATEAPRTSLRQALRSVMHNRPFLHFTLMWTVWCFTSNMAASYFIPYSMNSMGLSFLQITLFGTVTASVATVAAVKHWGRLLDRFGSRNVMLVSCLGASLSPLFFLFSTPGSPIPLFLYNFLGALFWSGSNLACNGMQLSASPDEDRSSYIALFSCVSCLAGTALGTLCGGELLDVFGTLEYAGGFMDKYKLLFLLSVVLRFTFTLVLTPGLPNDHEGSLRDLFTFRKKVPQGK